MQFLVKDSIGGLPLINGVEFKPADGGGAVGGPVDGETAKLFEGVPRFALEPAATGATAPRGRKKAEEKTQSQPGAEPAPAEGEQQQGTGDATNGADQAGGNAPEGGSEDEF